MATDKGKGLLGAAQEGLRGTTGALTGEGAWHSVNADVYHDNKNCMTGGNISPENLRKGKGGKELCGECKRLNTAGGPIGNLTNL